MYAREQRNSKAAIRASGAYSLRAADLALGLLLAGSLLALLLGKGAGAG
jgi:hypothetical protein